MNIRYILPVALVAALGFACAGKAQASPITGAKVTSASLGGVRVGVGVGFPIGGHSHVHGYWTTQTVPMQVTVQVPYQTTVQVPDHVIGTDVNGNPIWSYRTEVRTQFRTEVQTQWVTQQVWVPVHTHYRSRPHGWLGLGFRIR